MVGDLLREDVVEPLPGLGGEPHQEPVQLARGVDQLRVEESVSKWNHRQFSSFNLLLINETKNMFVVITRASLCLLNGHLLQHALDQRVAESECCRSKGVENGGVDGGIVLGAEAWPGQRQDVELVHEVCAEHARQPLIIGDVLKLAALRKLLHLLTQMNYGHLTRA